MIHNRAALLLRGQHIEKEAVEREGDRRGSAEA